MPDRYTQGDKMTECTTLFEAVFVCNILILIFSGVVNIVLCERLRRRKCELCAAHQRSFHSLAVPPQPNSPASDTSSHLDQESTELNYTMLQFPEDNTRTENSENEQREEIRKDTVYSSLKNQISNITEEN
ncbi:hypothetical protein R3I94_000952 [Phoxinus phoxinus]